MIRSANQRIAATAAVLCTAAVSLAQVPLSLDPTFRTEIESANVFSAWPLPDGKVIISGILDFTDLTGTRSGARLFSTGDRDPGFVGGFMGGKIIPWQDRFYAQNDQIVRRFLMDGSLDPTFIMMNADPYFSSLQGGDYHVFPDGRVLMTGLHVIDAPQLGFDGAYNLVWFFSDGHLDTTRVHRTGDGVNWAIKEYPAATAGGLGGNFLVHTWGTQYEGHPVDRVFRIHDDGSLDTTFHTHINWGYIAALEPLDDGRAYICGTFGLEGDPDTLQVIRVLPNGNLDPTFNNALDMLSTNPTTLNAKVICLYRIAPGLIILGGNFNEVEGEPRKGICMVDSSGSLISAYLSDAACGDYNYFGSIYGYVSGMTQAPNGDYYIWGAYHGYTDGTTNDPLQRMITRMHGGEIGLGLPEPNVSDPSFSIYPNPSHGFVTVALEVLPKDALLVVRDALGREVHRQRVFNYTTTMQLLGAPSGVYTVELHGAGERRVQRLVVE